MSTISTFNPVGAIYSDERLPEWESNGAAVLHLLEPAEGVNPIIAVASERVGLNESINKLQKGVRAGIHFIPARGSAEFDA